MDIFISWSGDRSRHVATFLENWLRQVIQSTRPWTSDSIEKGTRWSSEIMERLGSTDYGIVVVTPENQEKPWLNFEAGALAKKLDSARVSTLLVDMEPTDVAMPLSFFQPTRLLFEDVRKLIGSINGVLNESERLPDKFLDQSFDRSWADFEEMIRSMPEPSERHPARDQHEIAVETLLLVREIAYLFHSQKIKDVEEVRKVIATLPPHQEKLLRKNLLS